MKKIFLTAGILMVTAITATYAQFNVDDNNTKEVKSTKTLNEIQKEGTLSNQNAVSVFTRDQFASDFPDATNIRFERTNGLNKVNYSQNGRKTTAYYDNNSELIGTFRNRSFRDLPADAQIKIENEYPQFKVVEVLQFNMHNDNESYLDNSNTNLNFIENIAGKGSNNYFVELKNDNTAIVLEVGLSGEISFFSTIK